MITRRCLLDTLGRRNLISTSKPLVSYRFFNAGALQAAKNTDLLKVEEESSELQFVKG